MIKKRNRRQRQIDASNPGGQEEITEHCRSGEVRQETKDSFSVDWVEENVLS